MNFPNTGFDFSSDDVSPAIEAIYVKDVQYGSPAYLAGLRKYDRILAVDGKPGCSYANIIRHVKLSMSYLVLDVVWDPFLDSSHDESRLSFLLLSKNMDNEQGKGREIYFEDATNMYNNNNNSSTKSVRLSRHSITRQPSYINAVNSFCPGCREAFVSKNIKTATATTSETTRIDEDSEGCVNKPSCDPFVHSLKRFFHDKNEETVYMKSDYTLQPAKEGILCCKTVNISKKKAVDRSWRGAWAILLQNGALYLCKEKRKGVLIPLLNVPFPLELRDCRTELAMDYKKRKRIFRIMTMNGTEILFQTSDIQSLYEWLYEINRTCKSTYDLPDFNKDVAALCQAQRNRRRFVPSPLFRRSVSACLRRSATITSIKSNENQDKNYGIQLEKCEPSSFSMYVPVVVELLSKLIEGCGLSNIGIYRQTGSVQTTSWLISQLNFGVENIDFTDDRWKDMKAIASALKTFFSKLPECLFSNDLYTQFIETSQIENYNVRLENLRMLVHKLSPYRFETLKYLCSHFRVVASMSECNKVDVRNIAIIFGPTLLWHPSRSLEANLADNPQKVRVIESVILYSDWVFSKNKNSLPDEIDAACVLLNAKENKKNDSSPVSIASEIVNAIKERKLSICSL